jgi:GT2 family glycosyltransferase
MRPEAILTLLASVKKQFLYPNEIIIIDGSLDDKTKGVFDTHQFSNLNYFKVDKKDRGLTKQRNYGISKVNKETDIVCFLDDDTILSESYFEKLIHTYKEYPNAGGVGGFVTNEVKWKKLEVNEKASFSEFEIDGWVRKLGARNLLRKKLYLLSDKPPCIMPEFSNGFSVGSLPPNNKIYLAEHFMGGVSSFKKEVVDNIKFSEYFEGYGLYEDLEYCLRVSKKHQLYVNTGAKLEHHHEAGGRPNQFFYGKMMVRNGWFVWRTKYDSPTFKARFKWNVIIILLMMIRFTNVFNTAKKKEALSETLGRFLGWLSLIFMKPKIKNF